MEFPIQIIVNPTLPEEKNLWLKNLSNKIGNTKSIEQLAYAYEGKKDNQLYSSVMDILIRANEQKFSEVKEMCEALKELFKDELEERWNDGIKIGISQGFGQGFGQGLSQGFGQGLSQGKRQGIISTLVQLVRDGLLSVSVAAERAQMSEEEFQKQL